MSAQRDDTLILKKMDFNGTEISKAGNSLRKWSELTKEQKDHVLDVLAFLRLCHEAPLGNAVTLLKATTASIDRNAIYGKRLKRAVSIYKKLRRFEKMSLRNMQDIGGCRAIVATEKKLWQSVRALRRCKEFRTKEGRIRAKDYITQPKDTGYRSYHLVGTFKNDTGPGRNIEIQIRTKVQHYWATAVEIVDLFTGQALKSNNGDAKWAEFFKEVGFLFSILDSIHLVESSTILNARRQFIARLSKHPAGKDSLENAVRLSKRLKVVESMEGYANSIQIVSEQLQLQKEKGYVLIKIDPEKKTVNTMYFPESENELANLEYSKAEKESARNTRLVVALVSSTALGGIKASYPNYFADSTEFIKRLMFIQNS